MRKDHRILSYIVLIFISFISIYFGLRVTPDVAQSIVTFLSVGFGFYMTSIAILYNSNYTKIIHEKIYDDICKRGTHVMRDYFIISGTFSLFSIVIAISFPMLMSSRMAIDSNGEFKSIIVPFVGINTDIFVLFSSFLVGITVLNAVYMLLMLRTLIYGWVEAADSQ